MCAAGSQPDWEGEADASGYHAANYIAYSLHRPEHTSIYVGYNPYNYPMQIEIPAPPNGEGFLSSGPSGLAAVMDPYFAAWSQTSISYPGGSICVDLLAFST